MIRFIFLVIFVLLFLILGSPLLVTEYIIGKFSADVKSRRSLAIVKWAFRVCLFIAGTKVTVIGEENVPKDEAVLYVGNHRSYFDIVAGYMSIDGCCGFVAKKEMEKIPILATWMRLISCLFLDRKNVKEGLKTILAAIDQVKAGISVWIFPEGTRSQNEEMLEFKEGSMKIAEKSGCAIIPVAFKGTDDIFEKHMPFIRASHVQVQFGEPIYPKQLSREEKKFLGALVRGKIQDMLDEME